MADPEIEALINADDRSVPNWRFQLYVDMPNFDIRNGPPEAAVSLLVRPAIPEAYRWINVPGIAPQEAKNYVDVYVAEQAEYFHEHPPAVNRVNLTGDQTRKAAIVLGCIRALATTFYRLGQGDFIAGETAVSKMEYGTAVAATETTPAVPGGIRFKQNVPQATRARMRRSMTFTALEEAIITELIPMAVGVIPLQGFSILNCGHHYISTPSHSSFKAFLAVERAHWKLSTNADWFTSDEAILRDIMWHKSCHPVNMTLKEKAAANIAVKEQLVTAGAGAAAARLPATEASVRACDSYATLFAVLKQNFAAFQGGINTTVLDLANRSLKTFLPGDAGQPTGTIREAGIPEWVVDRRTCIRWMEQIVARNQATAAQCYGFYCAMSDAGAALGVGGAVDSLRNAHSLKKLMTSHIPSYTMGYQSYGDYAAAKAKLRSKAVFEAPIFVIE